FFFSRPAHTLELHSFPTRRSSDLSAWKTMISSIRLMNSGRKLCRSTSIRSSFSSSNEALCLRARPGCDRRRGGGHDQDRVLEVEDRKSTCLNSSHLVISYAVFCLK